RPPPAHPSGGSGGPAIPSLRHRPRPPSGGKSRSFHPSGRSTRGSSRPLRRSASWPRSPGLLRLRQGSPTPARPFRWRPRRRPSEVPCSFPLRLWLSLVSVLALARTRAPPWPVLLRGGEPQCFPIRHQPRPVDVAECHFELVAVYVHPDAVALHAEDPALQPAPAFLGQLQADLHQLAAEPLEVRGCEQRAVKARRRHLQRVVAADGIFHVQLRPN